MRLNTLGRMLSGRHAPGRRWAARCRTFPFSTVETMETRVLLSVAVAVDYSYDADNFFNSQAKKDLMQAAANAFAAQLNDNLTAITPSGFNTWSAQFPDPATGTIRSVSNLSVPAGALILYVGGGHLAGSSEAGLGSTGGYNATGDQNWLNNVAARGQAGALVTPATDFGPWGGSISFDDSGSTNWYFSPSLGGIGSNQTDFLSVAEHEIGHVLGIGTAPSWTAQVSGGTFHGPNADAVHGAPVPVNANGDHWADNVKSDGVNALMDPVLLNGTRSAATSLDFAGLKDVGWQVQSLTGAVQFSASGYSTTEKAAAATITVLRNGGGGAFTVQYSTSNGTASAGTDYQTTAGTLSFAIGDTSKSFSIPILNDHAADGAETVNIALSTPTNGATIGATGTAVLTITDANGHATGDFDSDGRTDLAVFRPSTAQFWVSQSTAGILSPIPVFGATKLSDIPIVGDFDGIGKPEVAIFRPSTAQWFVLGPNGGHLVGTFGATNLFDIPVPGDYDGTGKTELAVFRPSTAQWFVLGPTGGRLLGTFGATNLFDIPVPGDYDGTGKTELAVFRPSTAQWFVMGTTGGRLLGTFGAPNLADLPVPGDYDGLGRTELAVYRTTTGQWFVLGPNGGHYQGTWGDVNQSDVPFESSVGSLVKLGTIKASATRAFSAQLVIGPTGATPSGPTLPATISAPPARRRNSLFG